MVPGIGCYHSWPRNLGCCFLHEKLNDIISSLILGLGTQVENLVAKLSTICTIDRELAHVSDSGKRTVVAILLRNFASCGWTVDVL